MNNIDGEKKFKQILLKLTNTYLPNEIQKVPVVIGIGALSIVMDEFIWYQTYFSFTVPVITDSKQRLHLDENNYDNYIKNNLNFDDILRNKTNFNRTKKY